MLWVPAFVEEGQARAGVGTGTGCDVMMSDDDVTRLESCLDDVGRPFVVNYTKSQRRRRKQPFDVCRFCVRVTVRSGTDWLFKPALAKLTAVMGTS